MVTRHRQLDEAVPLEEGKEPPEAFEAPEEILSKSEETKRAVSMVKGCVDVVLNNTLKKLTKRRSSFSAVSTSLMLPSPLPSPNPSRRSVLMSVNQLSQQLRSASQAVPFIGEKEDEFEGNKHLIPTM